MTPGRATHRGAAIGGESAEGGVAGARTGWKLPAALAAVAGGGLMRARLSASAFSGPSDARRMSAIPGETRAQ